MVDFHRTIIIEHRLEEALVSVKMPNYENHDLKRYRRHRWAGYNTAVWGAKP